MKYMFSIGFINHFVGKHQGPNVISDNTWFNKIILMDTRRKKAITITALLSIAGFMKIWSLNN